MATVSQQEFLKGGKKIQLIAPASDNVGVPEEQKKPGFFSRVGEDLKKRGSSIAQTFKDTASGKINPLETGVQTAGAVAGGVNDILGEGVKSAVEALPESVKEPVRQGAVYVLQTRAGQAGLNAISQGIEKYAGWKSENPQLAKDLESVVNIASLLPIGKGGQVAKEGVEQVAKKSAQFGAETFGKINKSLFGEILEKPVSSVDDLIKVSDELLKKPSQEASGELLTVAKQQSPKLSIREKWAGVRPDIKKQIQGKHEKLQTYFDIAHARNLDVNVPTPLEFGVKRAETARDAVDNLIENKGSSIGKFREKIQTYKVPLEKVQSVINDFDSELGKLNLQIKNRQIVRSPGAIKKVSDSEIKLLQDFRENLNVIRERPTVDSVIQNRIAADNNINFAKSAKEASNIIDPISRKMRSRLAQVNRETIGKSEAKLLEDYTNLFSFLEEFNGYLNRKAGGEFMLKRVLSERGGETRALINTLKEYTGIDLLDDATMAQIATDLIGNTDQVGLFRKEITKAGLDATALLRGDKLGAAKMLLDYGVKKVANPEKTFLQAAGKK